MADSPAPTGVDERHGNHGHRGTRAIQRMVEFAPSTGGLALWVRHVDLPPTDVARRPPVATDGHTLYYDAAFERLPLAAQAGQVAHEVLHVALRHAQRYRELRARIGDADLQLFNTCADAIVNSTLEHLSWLELPRDAVRLDRLLESARIEHGGVEQALLQWDVERLYRAIDDRRVTDESRAGRHEDPRQAASGAGRPHDGPRAASVRALGDPDGASDLLDEDSAEDSPETQAEQTREWSERILRAHAGDGAFSMLRSLLADLPGSRTPWEQVLRTRLARGLSRRPSLSWSRPSRSYLANQGRIGAHGRLPFEPGFSGTKTTPRLALVVDVSGSIEPELLERFTREIEAILRRQEAALTLVIGDDQVRRIDEMEPQGSRSRRLDLRTLDFHGGGGTDFTPLLEAADLRRPDIGVVLTDLDGPVRFTPRWPAIWAVPSANAGVAAPFGRLLVLD